MDIPAGIWRSTPRLVLVALVSPVPLHHVSQSLKELKGLACPRRKRPAAPCTTSPRLPAKTQLDSISPSVLPTLRHPPPGPTLKTKCFHVCRRLRRFMCRQHLAKRYLQRARSSFGDRTWLLATCCLADAIELVPSPLTRNVVNGIYAILLALRHSRPLSSMGLWNSYIL